MHQRLWPHQAASATARAMAALHQAARAPGATQAQADAARLSVALWYALDRIGGSDAHARHWLSTGDLDRPARILAAHEADEHDRQALHVLRALATADPRNRARAITLAARVLERTTPRGVPVIDPNAPALSSADADTPTQDELRTWAEQYLPAESAAAWAEHIHTDWEEYEPEGELTIEQFLCGLMRSWRGEDGGYPPTPRP